MKIYVSRAVQDRDWFAYRLLRLVQQEYGSLLVLWSDSLRTKVNDALWIGPRVGQYECWNAVEDSESLKPKCIVVVTPGEDVDVVAYGIVGKLL